MSHVCVVVATTSPDVKAHVLAEYVAAHDDMILLKDRAVSVVEAEEILGSLADGAGCALVIVGSSNDSSDLAQDWLARRSDLVVLHVDLVGSNVQITLRDPGMEMLLTTLRELVHRFGTEKRQRVAHLRLSPQGPLMRAAIEWVHARLQDAVARISDDNGDVHGLSITQATLSRSLDEEFDYLAIRHEADRRLDDELSSLEKNDEPLAVAARVFELELRPLEFRLMVLVLAPELDHRYQRCIGFLLDDLGRRVGTMGLYSSLLGLNGRVRDHLTQVGSLADWHVFEQHLGQPAAADESRSGLIHTAHRWLLGEDTAPAADQEYAALDTLPFWPGRGTAVPRRSTARDRRRTTDREDPWYRRNEMGPAGRPPSRRLAGVARVRGDAAGSEPDSSRTGKSGGRRSS